MRNDAHGRIHKSLIEIEIVFVSDLFLRRRSNYCVFYSGSLSNCFTLLHSFRMGLFRLFWIRFSLLFQESKVVFGGGKT